MGLAQQRVRVSVERKPSTRAARTSIERLQCFEGLTAKHAIGEFDESLQRLYLELATRTEKPNWKALAREITSRDFFIPGPLLKAILAKQPCVLLIGELDKVDQAIEAMLLEILSVWQISDPRLAEEAARPATGAIHIELPGGAMISVESGADSSLVCSILESLRQ